MDVIDQRLVVREWPLKNPGDDGFFGYVVALGVFPREWCSDGLFAYVDFAYNQTYTRYRLPNDPALINQLLEYLCGNLETLVGTGDVHGKVWVTLTTEGHKVSLP
jgi:hypothetical protein